MRRRFGFLALFVAVLLGVVVLVLMRRGREDGHLRLALRSQLLERQVRGAEALLGAARSGPLLSFEDVLVTVNEELVQELLSAAMPYERVVDDYRIRLTTARVRFREGLALVELAGRASLAGRDERTAFADFRVYGELQVVGLDPASGVLHARVPIVGVEIPQLSVLGLSPLVRALVQALAREPLEDFAELASDLEIPVAVESDIDIPAVEDDDVRIGAATLPLRVVVEDVKAAAGKLWVAIGVEVPPEAADSVVAGSPRRSVADPSPLPARPAMLAAAVGPTSPVGVLDAFNRAGPQEPGAGAPAVSILELDPAQPDSADTPAMEAMRRRYVALRDSLLALAARDTLLARLAADTADVAVGLRPALVNRLLGRAAAAYLDRVELTLELEEDEEEVEDLEVETPLGEAKVGDYRVDVTIHPVEGALAAGTPRVSFASGNRLDVVIPARIVSGGAAPRCASRGIRRGSQTWSATTSRRACTSRATWCPGRTRSSALSCSRPMGSGSSSSRSSRSRRSASPSTRRVRRGRRRAARSPRWTTRRGAVSVSRSSAPTRSCGSSSGSLRRASR